MQQPSAQGIASLYRGNPAPLQQSIQKDQQAKPGLPPDLQKMLALQIVNNEKDSVTAQKAMDQLQQMSGQQGGKPPTVMQSLEQQAQQKMQAQAVQAQQKQQGIQALMQQAPAGPVPEGTPQPEMQPQPQGIDQSDRVAFAGAEGGIVAFAKGGDGEYETRYDRMNRKNRGELTEEERKEQEERDALIAQIPTDRNTVRGGERVEGSELDRNVRNTMSALPGASAARALSGGAGAVRGVAAGLAQLADRKEPAAPPAAPAPMAMDNQSAAETARLQRQRSLPQAPAPAPTRGLPELAARRAPAPAPAPAPKLEAPVAAPAPAVESDAMNLVKARMAETPEARETAAMAKYEQMVGKPDTAQHDRLIAELEKRKQSLEPKQGFDGLMEYLGQVSANSQPGRGSFASGAAGARGMDKLNNERKLEQFELSKQAIEVSQKKLDTVRSYAKETYGIGKSAFDQVYKDQFDAAKEVVKDESAARQLAQQNTLKMLELKQQADLRREEMRSNEKVAGMRMAGAGTESKEIAAAEAAFARDPEAKALMKTMEAYAMSPTNPNAVRAATRLREIQAAKYAQFGIKMEPAPGAGSSGGTSTSGWGKAQVVK